MLSEVTTGQNNLLSDTSDVSDLMVTDTKKMTEMTMDEHDQVYGRQRKTLRAIWLVCD